MNEAERGDLLPSGPKTIPRPWRVAQELGFCPQLEETYPIRVFAQPTL